jgi:hypothetical protein
VEGAIVAAALLAVAFWIRDAAGRRAVLLTPLVWLSIPTLLTLQIGNLHLAAIAAAMLAMLAFERGRSIVGGAILGALTVFKIFPGILILLLVFQRRWRSAAWTIGFATALLVVAMVVLGRAPFDALFAYHSRLERGGVRIHLRPPRSIAANMSVWIAQTIAARRAGMSGETPVVVSWAYTFALVALCSGGA